MNRLMILASLLLATSPSSYAEEDIARPLVEKHCLKCHGTDIFTREDHKISNLQSLNTQVRRCDANLELGWFDDELDAVSDYLNNHYYHF